MPELVIVVGVIFIHIALVLYSIFIYKERKYRRATNGVVGFITAAVIFDVSATICMMVGTVEDWLTLHGVLGYSALTVMVTDAVFIWRHRLNHGTEIPFSDTLNRNTMLGFILWLIAFGTGEMIAVMKHYV